MPLFKEVATGNHCYFVHSYHVEPLDAGVIAAVTQYGSPFVSAVCKDNVVACQFHPEKSQAVGLQIMKNFGAWK
jgi:glutamine amidotransferase